MEIDTYDTFLTCPPPLDTPPYVHALLRAIAFYKLDRFNECLKELSRVHRHTVHSDDCTTDTMHDRIELNPTIRAFSTFLKALVLGNWTALKKPFRKSRQSTCLGPS